MALYGLSKIGNSHIVLENKKLEEVNVIEGAPTYCKIRLIGKAPPLVIQVMYKSIVRTDLFVHGSYFKHMPDDSECDYEKNRPR